MWVAPGNLALGEVEMNLVWKQPVSAPRAGKMHCTSTIIASTAPVMMASSCCRKLPAMGMPWRIRISLPVQQMPTTLMPFAPCFSARASISGSCAAATIISDSVGSWPWTMMLTWSSLSTPRLASERMGVGVPKSTSDSSVAIIEPPQPSAMEVRKPLQDQVDRVVVHADVGAVHDLDDLAVDAARVDAQLLPQFDALCRRAAGELDGAFLLAKLGVGGAGQIQGDLFLAPALGLDAVLGRQRVQLGLVLDLVAAALALGGQEQRVGDVAPVVRVGGRAGGDHADQVAGDDDVGRRSADAQFGPIVLKGTDAAGAHVAVAAADAQLAKAALGQLGLVAIPGGLEAQFLGPGQHLVGSRVNAPAQDLFTVLFRHG